MKAIVTAKYGPPEGLQLREIEKPVPGDNELLVRIHATTVTFGDAALRRMKFPVRLVFRFFVGGLKGSKILGHEFAGVIESVGEDVSRFKVGDQVFGSAGFQSGAHAEYICLPEDEMVAIKPVNMTYEQAAAVPVGGNTALYILKEANIQKGQRVLVYGASGSVGTYAVQLANSFGAEVTGVCSTRNVELVKSLGAEVVIDYTQEDFTQSGQSYDVIFDAVNKISAEGCKGALKENGRFLSVASSTEEDVENLVFLRDLIEAGKLRAVIDRNLPLEEIAVAHKHVDSGHKAGNVVITVRQSEMVG